MVRPYVVVQVFDDMAACDRLVSYIVPAQSVPWHAGQLMLNLNGKHCGDYRQEVDRLMAFLQDVAEVRTVVRGPLKMPNSAVIVFLCQLFD